MKVVVDRTVVQMSDFICGANQAGYHYAGVNWGRDLPEPDLVADIRNVVVGDPSPDGKGELAIQRGIEVGHVFYLGTKYSAAMNATYLDETGKRFCVTGISGALLSEGDLQEKDVAVLLAVEGVGLVERDLVAAAREIREQAAVIGGGPVPVG